MIIMIIVIIMIMILIEVLWSSGYVTGLSITRSAVRVPNVLWQDIDLHLPHSTQVR